MLTALALASIVATPSDDFLLSTDGVTYSAASPDLFAGDGLLIPGTSVTDELWVRSTRAEPIWVQLSVGDVVVSDSAMGRSAQLRTGLGDGALGNAVAADAIGDCRQVSAPAVLEQGDTVHLTLRVDLDEAASNATQRGTFTFAVLVSAADAAAPAPTADACRDPEVVVPATPSTPEAPAPGPTPMATAIAGSGLVQSGGGSGSGSGTPGASGSAAGGAGDTPVPQPTRTGSGLVQSGGDPDLPAALADLPPGVIRTIPSIGAFLVAGAGGLLLVAVRRHRRRRADRVAALAQTRAAEASA